MLKLKYIMHTMFHWAALCLIIGFCHVLAQTEDSGGLDDLIKDVFSNNNNNNNTGSRGPDNTQNNGDGTNTGGGDFSLQPIPGTGTGDSGATCTCVPYYLCNNGSVNTNGEGIIDIRIDEGPCRETIQICCDKTNQVEEPITPPPNKNKNEGCGYRNPQGVGFRITGNNDNEAEYGEFPWMVAILREESVEGNPQKLNVYQCGGALIHPKVVVTAAHCVSGKNKKFKVRVGEWDTQTTKELYPHQDREVESIVSHPQFYAGALYNDIAILFLDSPVQLAENVNVICLPPKDVKFDNTRCVASGWGKDVFGKQGKYQVILKKIELPFMERRPCQTALRRTRLGELFELHRSFICAGGERGKDTCKGDGGSPLVCPIKGQKDRYAHAGIVAWGIDCGQEGTPGVYASVAHFRDWIDEQLSYNNIQDRPYEY